MMLGNQIGSYIRKAQVLVSPLRESLGISNRNNAVVLNSTGLYDDLRIVFTVQKNIMAMGQPNTLQVSFYNLAQETKQLLSKQATAFLLELGYERGATPLQTVASAGISSVTSKREGAAIVTTVFGYDGQDGLAQAVSNKAYRGVTQLKQIVADLAADIPGIEVSVGNINIDDGLTTGSKGRVLTGRTSNLLQRLAREFGFSWTIDTGVFKAIADTLTNGNLFNVSSTNGNLMSATPRIDNVVQRFFGIDIATVLDARINPGDLVRLDSTVNPQINGVYQATSVVHVGDTHANVWSTNITCLLNQEQIQSAFTSANAPGFEV